MFFLIIDYNYFLSWNKKYIIYLFWMYRKIVERKVNK